MSNLILHAVVAHKPYFKTKEKALEEVHNMFPDEKTKSFVRETDSSFRVRIHPKTEFIKSSYVTKIINPSLSLVFARKKKPEEPEILSLFERVN